MRGTNTGIDPKRIHGTDGTDETIPRTTVQSARILTQNSPSNLRNKTSSDGYERMVLEQSHRLSVRTKGSPDDVCARNKHDIDPKRNPRHGRHERDQLTHYCPIRADFDPELTE